MSDSFTWQIRSKQSEVSRSELQLPVHSWFIPPGSLWQWPGTHPGNSTCTVNSQVMQKTVCSTWQYTQCAVPGNTHSVQYLAVHAVQCAVPDVFSTWHHLWCAVPGSVLSVQFLRCEVPGSTCSVQYLTAPAVCNTWQHM